MSNTYEGQPCGAFAPGEPGYVAQLKLWDQGFQQFFDDLNAMGINKSNTLFVIHADENDHYAGSAPLNPSCDGVKVPCQYDRTKVGEITTDLPLLLKNQNLYDFGISGGTGSTPGTPRPGFTNTSLAYAIDYDTAPGFWLKGDPAQGSPSQRLLEHALSNVTAPNPYRGTTNSQLFSYLIDLPGLKALHMVTSDSNRTAGVVGFGQEDHYIQMTPLISSSSSGPYSYCNNYPATTDATCLDNGFIWLHGDYAPDIDRTWASFVGPGVEHLGRVDSIWTDHTDVRPTMMTLICLKDSYSYEGRAVLEAIQPSALPPSVAARRDDLISLGQEYKQINAPVGAFGAAAIDLSTFAIRSDDATYSRLESVLRGAVAERDQLASQMQAELGKVPGCGGLAGRPINPGVGPGFGSSVSITFGDLGSLRNHAVDLKAEMDGDLSRH
ncbi:MAG: hypothetical protein JO057_27545 [Chloroflexi bacterium]|nr:hypothetical protein [Chloroflexota bacterium]